MKKENKSTLYLIFFVYCLFLIMVLFLRSGREVNVSPEAIRERFDTYVNLTPFGTIDNYVKALRNGNLSRTVFLWNIVGNLVLFVPMGMFLPHLKKRLSGCIRCLGNILLIIVLIEALQLILGVGSLDIDDVILNFTGSVVGYVIYLIFRPRKRRKRKSKKQKTP